MKKIWILVSSGMFLIPEILWSPVINYLYEFTQIFSKSKELHGFRDTFLSNGNYGFVWYGLILLIQFFGVLGLLYNLYYLSKERKSIVILFGFVVFTLIAILVAIEFYFVTFVSVSFP